MERRDGNPTGVDFQRVDELVREYLIFRGFLNTVKVFATERKADKVKGIQPDRIVDQLQAYVLNFEPLNLIDLWKYMEARFFSRLDPRFAKTTKKLEQSLKRYYVVHCMQTNNYGKCKEFFELFADELSGDDEWRSWFMLPFLRTADLPAEFEPYFNKQWQDVLLVSMHNFISTVLANLPLPQIVQFDKLQRENGSLASTVEAQQRELYSLHNSLNHYKKKSQAAQPPEPAESASSASQSRVKNVADHSKGNSVSSARSDGSSTRGTSRESEAQERYICRPIREYKGHREAIQGLRFSADGTLLAACTRDKVKVFCSGLDDRQSTATTCLATFDCMADINCMEWNGINVQVNKLLLTGHTNNLPNGSHGCIKVWSPEASKCMREISNEHVKKRVDAITVNPSGTICIIASDSLQSRSPCSLVAMNLRQQKVDTRFEVAHTSGLHSPVVHTMEFNHNGSCFVTGADNGQLGLFDIKQRQSIMSWQAHPRSVDCVHWKHDETSVFTVGNDHVITEWSIHKAGQVLNSYPLANCLVPSVIGGGGLPGFTAAADDDASATRVEYSGGWIDIVGHNSRRIKYLMSHDFSFSPNGTHLVVTPPCLVYQCAATGGIVDTQLVDWRHSHMASVHWHPTQDRVFAGAVMNDTTVRSFQLTKA